MSESKLKGKRYICLVRASHGTQEISTDAQLKLLHAAVERDGMIFVHAEIVDGLTGSLPGKRRDLEKLLERKKTKNDFEVLVLQRCDRLTRGGLRHGFWFEWECQRLGIELLIVGDDIPTGEHADLVRVLKYQAAKEQAYSISQRSTQGSQFALEQGRVIPSSRTPFGCWRLYHTADGKPSHIIRNLADGRQEKLAPVTHAVIDTYGTAGGGSKGHYRKQKDEKPLLMPGDANKADAVRNIFQLHYMEGLCGKRIADVLNRKGIRSPMGKKWSQHQVESIYNNEVYTGRAICNRTSNAIYHQRRKNAPKKVELDAQTYATARWLKVEQRPFEEWEIKDEPLMKDFLDPTVRERAMTAHERRWAKLGDPNRPKQSKNKHKASDYLLSELFFAKQDGGKLTGIPCGPKHKKVRYYRHRNQRVGYEKGSIYNGMFPAAPLEQAVVGIIAEQLQNLPELREQIIKIVVEQSALLETDVNKVEDLRKRREQVRARTQMLVSTLDEATLADAKPELDRLSAERRDLDEQIAVAEAAVQTAAVDPQQVADRVIERLKCLQSDWQTLPPFALREVVGTLVEKAVGDMASKDVEVRLRLPSWAFSLENGDSSMRLEDGLRSQMFYETHALKLGVFDCRYLLRAAAPVMTADGVRRHKSWGSPNRSSAIDSVSRLGVLPSLETVCFEAENPTIFSLIRIGRSCISSHPSTESYMETITIPRVKFTARQLVRHWYSGCPVCEQAVDSAIVEMMRRGWLTAFIPRATEWDRPMVFVAQRSDFAGIIRYIDQRSTGVVPRGLIESRTQSPIEHIATGMFLAHVGIGITAFDGNNIFIRGTNPGLAMMTFQVRKRPLERMPMEGLVKATTGRHIPRRLWNDDLRLRVALAFEEFNCDVPGVLADDIESDVLSRWSFPLPPPSPPSPPWTPSDPSFPTAPIDPGIPPF